MPAKEKPTSSARRARATKVGASNSSEESAYPTSAAAGVNASAAFVTAGGPARFVGGVFGQVIRRGLAALRGGSAVGWRLAAGLAADFFGALLHARFELLGLLAARLFGGLERFLAGFFGPFHRLLGDLAGDIFAAVERLLAGFSGGFLDLVGQRADPFVLDPGARQHHPDQEATGDAGQGQPQRVFLGDADGTVGTVFELPAVGSGFTDFVGGAFDLVDEALALVGDRLLDPGFDVGLVGQSVDGLPHF